MATHRHSSGTPDIWHKCVKCASSESAQYAHWQRRNRTSDDHAQLEQDEIRRRIEVAETHICQIVIHRVPICAYGSGKAEAAPAVIELLAEAMYREECQVARSQTYSIAGTA